MSVLLRESFHTSLCEGFYSNIVSGRDNFYYFIGGSLPWNISDIPPDYVGTVEEEMSVRNDIISVKKVTPSDIAFGVARYDWASGLVFDMYDSTETLDGKQFYVLTDQFNVYKCLFNNSGAVSTQKPVGTDYEPRLYSDGYMWKYLYSIPKSLRNKFLLPEIMPVFRSISDIFYDEGNIREVIINNGGSGYQQDNAVSIVISGPNTTPAVLRAVVGYGGQILDVKIIEAGSGYLAPPTIQIIANAGASGLFPGNNTAIIECIMVGGSVARVVIRDPGQNYTNDIRTTISIDGDESGAVFVPFIEDGQITDVIVENEGSGYTFANLTVFSALDPVTNSFPGSGASLSVSLDQGNLESVQAIVEQTAIDGAIHAVKLVSGGSGYFSAPIVTIDGDGTGFEAIAEIASGSVRRIIVTDPGTGYSFGNLVIDGEGTGVVGYPIISPTGGHGKNAVNELNTNSIILSTSITNEPVLGVRIQNDYRQYGLLKNIRFFQESKKFNRQLGSGCFKIRVSSTANIFKDVDINVDGKIFSVIEIFTDLVIVRAKNNKLLSVGEIGVSTGEITTFTILEVTNPDINKYTGTLQYVNNQMAIEYSNQQSLTLRTVITL